MRFVGETDRNGFPVLRQPEACNSVHVSRQALFAGDSVAFKLSVPPGCLKARLASVHVRCRHAAEAEHVPLQLRFSFRFCHVVLPSVGIALDMSILVRSLSWRR